MDSVLFFFFFINDVDKTLRESITLTSNISVFCLGFVIEGGVARCPYGAQKVQESLTVSLLSDNYKFHSTTEQLLVRYAMEKVIIRMKYL